ncbi:MAG: TRAP transporter substrate-binding protein [Succinatimonas hippei]|nr:TRAP transporter substrate-binding protein [Succinatimonas hippei]
MVKFTKIAILGAMMLTLPFAAANAKTYRVTFAGFYGPSHPSTLAMQKFKEELDKAGLDFKVVLKPNAEAGGEEKIMELVKQGSIQIALAGAIIKGDEPRIAPIEMPFALTGWDHARRVFTDPEVLKFTYDYSKNTGVLIKGYYGSGFRQVQSNFPITKMEDFKKFKLRVPLNDLFVQVFNALGAHPTPLPATELYTSLETKVVDGHENPFSVDKAAGYWEVQTNLLETNHIFSPLHILVNGKFFNSLPDEYKAAFDKAMKASIDYYWDIAPKDDADALKFMIDKGQVYTKPDEKFMQQMHEAMTPVYKWMDQKWSSCGAIRDFMKSKE